VATHAHPQLTNRSGVVRIDADKLPSGTAMS
jgi:hypothetical protein